jgi:DNA-binding NtrC family response regulator
MADLLIIDDDIDSADVLAQIMEMEGHEIRVGYNGEDGVRLAKERTPELVLLDIEMPLLDGPGMANEMLLHDMGLEHVPVVFLSASPDLSEIAARVGTPYFLAKPYGYDAVVALVQRALVERIAPTAQRW